jgi:general secretion pathway protein G
VTIAGFAPPRRDVRNAIKPGPRPRKDKQLQPINTDYDLYSVGKDGDSVAPLTAKKSLDDIVRAGEGAYVGLAKGL